MKIGGYYRHRESGLALRVIDIRVELKVCIVCADGSKNMLSSAYIANAYAPISYECSQIRVGQEYTSKSDDMIHTGCTIVGFDCDGDPMVTHTGREGSEDKWYAADFLDKYSLMSGKPEETIFLDMTEDLVETVPDCYHQKEVLDILDITKRFCR